MENIKFDRRALSQVYAIIAMLENEKLNKIPKKILEGIKDNRDVNFEVNMEEIEENMLPDTENILATIYTYYLANQEEKNTIFQMIELEKKQKYNNKEIFPVRKELIIKSETNMEMIPVKESFFVKIKKFLKRIFRR